VNTEKRNQKLFLTGSFLSLAGDSIFATAMMYYLSQIKHASFYLSLATLVLTIPSVFATFIGVFTDRRSPKNVMAVVRAIQAVLCLGLIWYFESIPILLVIVLLLEIFATINSVAGVSLTALIITPQNRSKIIGLLHAVQNSIQLGGRFFGAALLTWIHPVGVAMANSSSFVLALLCILGIRLPKKPKEISKENAKKSIIKEWGEGWKALYHDRLTARFTLAVAIGGAMLVPVQAFLSLILVNRLHANTFEFGLAFTMEMIGGIIGGLLGSPIIKRIVSRFGYAIVFFFDFLMMGLSTVVVGVTSQYGVIVGTMLILGLVQAFQNITAPTYFMLVNSKEVLGRVIGTVTSTQAFSALLASLILTGISTVVSVTWILVIAGGILCLSTIALFAFPLGVLKTNVQADFTKEQVSDH
jgi:MFS family permease